MTFRNEKGAGLLEAVLIIVLLICVAVPTFEPLQNAMKLNWCRVVKQRWDVTGYFDPETGRCKQFATGTPHFFW